jgi:glycosyltransferase involved in cell wall biosynthesis
VPRAAIVSPNPANRAGGVERVCAQLADALEVHGWEATIVGPARPPSRWEFRLGLSYPAMARSATAATRMDSFDLVVSNGFLGVGCPRRTARIQLYHGTMVGNTRAQSGSMPMRERLRRTISAGLTEARAGRGARRVVCVSELVAEEVRRYYRLRADAIIPNGVDTQVFAPRPRQDARARLGLPEDGRYALFVGRLEHGKGSDLVIEGAARGGCQLLIAGSSGAPGAHHLGVLEPEALADAYCASDCVLLPTRYEGCSLVVLEALACARPLVSTRVGWMQTLLRAVPEYEALCIEPDVADIARVLRSPLDREHMCAAARAFVLEHNNLERWQRRWVALCEEVAGSAGSALR